MREIYLGIDSRSLTWHGSCGSHPPGSHVNSAATHAVSHAIPATKPKDNTKARRRAADRSRAKPGKVHFEFIRVQMELTLSPEQIASLFPGEFKFTISPKAMYNYINQWGRNWSDLGNLLRRKLRIYRSKWRYNRG